MKKRIAKIAAAASIVACLGTVSAMAVVDAICEHKDVYIDKVIVGDVDISIYGHSYHYIGNVICLDCKLVLSSYEDDAFDPHTFETIETYSYDQVDDNGFLVTVTVEVKRCAYCGQTIEVVSEEIH